MGLFRLGWVLSVSLLCISQAWADTIYLKNGRQVEGIVQEEDGRQVVLDVGFGTIALEKTEILKVERSDEEGRETIVQQQRAEYFETGRWVPKGAEKLFELYKKVRDDREEAFKARLRQEGLIVKQIALESQIATLKQQHLPLAERLNTIDPKSETARYNDLIQEMNSLSATVQTQYIQLEDLDGKITQADEEIHHYLNAFREFRHYARDEIGHFRKQPAGEAEKAFYDGVERTLLDMDGDFVQDAIASHRRGPNVMVDAVLNDKVKASLMVDTGASVTMISKEIANRLGMIGQTSPPGEIDVVVADGRVVKAQTVLLDSIRVGKTRVERSVAAILPTSERGMDGLLGMSFLKHFVVQVDGKNNLLILERLK